MTRAAPIAAISAQALIRHQNHRSNSTSPGPVPIRMRNRNTVPTSSMKNDTAAASTVSPMEHQRAAAISLRSSDTPAKRA